MDRDRQMARDIWVEVDGGMMVREIARQSEMGGERQINRDK